jgi:hypothetical protein
METRRSIRILAVDLHEEVDRFLVTFQTSYNVPEHGWQRVGTGSQRPTCQMTWRETTDPCLNRRTRFSSRRGRGNLAARA